MTVDELVIRFPEIPSDLHADPILADFAKVFDPYLQSAAKPSACSTDRSPENQAYMKLIGPMDIYRYGLTSREKVTAQLAGFLEAYAVSSDQFEDAMFERQSESS